MKNAILLLALVLCVCMSIFGQKIPQAAKDAFTIKFPDAENVKWDKENSSEYEANFRMNMIKMSAIFTKDGIWMETETAIEIAQLPQPVLDAISHNYSNGKLYGASKIVRAYGTVIYEADIKMNSKKKEVLFDELGNVVK